jgi:hypothetical protein
MAANRVLKPFDDALRVHFFLRHKTVWNRRLHQYVDVVEIQKGKDGHTATVNVGVSHEDVYRAAWLQDLPTVVDASRCIGLRRLGQLTEAADKWWNLEDMSTVQDMKARVISHALPFLEGLHTLPALFKFLVAENVERQRYPPPIMYLAVLKGMLGDADGACATLRRLEERVNQNWASRVQDVMEHLRCPRSS